MFSVIYEHEDSYTAGPRTAFMLTDQNAADTIDKLIVSFGDFGDNSWGFQRGALTGWEQIGDTFTLSNQGQRPYKITVHYKAATKTMDIYVDRLGGVYLADVTTANNNYAVDTVELNNMQAGTDSYRGLRLAQAPYSGNGPVPVFNDPGPGLYVTFDYNEQPISYGRVDYFSGNWIFGDRLDGVTDTGVVQYRTTLRDDTGTVTGMSNAEDWALEIVYKHAYAYTTVPRSAFLVMDLDAPDTVDQRILSLVDNGNNSWQFYRGAATGWESVGDTFAMDMTYRHTFRVHYKASTQSMDIYCGRLGGLVLADVTTVNNNYAVDFIELNNMNGAGTEKWRNLRIGQVPDPEDLGPSPILIAPGPGLDVTFDTPSWHGSPPAPFPGVDTDYGFLPWYWGTGSWDLSNGDDVKTVLPNCHALYRTTDNNGIQTGLSDDEDWVLEMQFKYSGPLPSEYIYGCGLQLSDLDAPTQEEARIITFSDAMGRNTGDTNQWGFRHGTAFSEWDIVGPPHPIAENEWYTLRIHYKASTRSMDVYVDKWGGLYLADVQNIGSYLVDYVALENEDGLPWNAPDRQGTLTVRNLKLGQVHEPAYTPVPVLTPPGPGLNVPFDNDTQTMDAYVDKWGGLWLADVETANSNFAVNFVSMEMMQTGRDIFRNLAIGTPGVPPAPAPVIVSLVLNGSGQPVITFEQSGSYTILRSFDLAGGWSVIETNFNGVEYSDTSIGIENETKVFYKALTN